RNRRAVSQQSLLSRSRRRSRPTGIRGHPRGDPQGGNGSAWEGCLHVFITQSEHPRSTQRRATCQIETPPRKILERAEDAGFVKYANPERDHWRCANRHTPNWNGNCIGHRLALEPMGGTQSAQKRKQKG